MVIFRRRRSREDGIDERTLEEDFETTLEPEAEEIVAADQRAEGAGFDKPGDTAQALAPDPGDDANSRTPVVPSAAGGAPAEETGGLGPYDEADYAGPLEGYMDFGCLRMRPVLGSSLHYNPQSRHVELAYPDLPARIRLQVLAAPKSSPLWDSVRADTMLEIARGAGASVEAHGEWGPYLQAQMLTGRSQAGVPVRHVGIDGPRWLLLVTAYDRAAMDDELFSSLLHAILDTCVVVRGQDPYPPREPLELAAPVLHGADGEVTALRLGMP